MGCLQQANGIDLASFHSSSQSRNVNIATGLLSGGKVTAEKLLNLKPSTGEVDKHSLKGSQRTLTLEYLPTSNPFRPSRGNCLVVWEL
jgi:hypothetical protein